MLLSLIRGNARVARDASVLTTLSDHLHVVLSVVLCLRGLGWQVTRVDEVVESDLLAEVRISLADAATHHYRGLVRDMTRR